jgi:hypothetical protein
MVVGFTTTYAIMIQFEFRSWQGVQTYFFVIPFYLILEEALIVLKAW